MGGFTVQMGRNQPWRLPVNQNLEVGYPGGGSDYPARAPNSHLPRLLGFLRRLWWVPVLTLAMAVAGAAFYLTFQPASYASSARMWVSGKLHIPEGSLYSEELQFFFGTQVELMQSEKIQQRALARVQTLNPDLKPSPVRVRVAQSPKSAIFQLSAVGSDPAYTQAHLNALIDEYLNYKKEIRAASSDDTLASISAQVYQQEKELKAEQEKLSSFQHDNSLAVLQEQSTAAAAYLSKLNAQLSDLKLEYQLIDSVSADPAAASAGQTGATGAALESRPSADTTLLSASSSSEFLTARQQVELLKIQRDELTPYLRPQHPKIQKLEEEIARGEKVLGLFRRQSRDQTETTKQVFKRKIDSVEDSTREWESKLMAVNTRLAEFDRLKANVLRIQSLYDRLLNLLQTVDVNKNLDQEIVSVMERASPAEATKEQMSKRLVLAALAGLVVGLGIVFLVARFDDRLTSINEVLQQFEEEILGQVPDVSKTKNNGKLEMVQHVDPRHMFAESYRSIRSSLLFMPSEAERPKLLLITSAVPSEGKSTIAANLARTMAFGGSRVLLIDADLRRGYLHELFETSREPGLVTFLHERARNGEGIAPTALPNLSLIPSGKPSNDSSELFLGGAFDEFLRGVQKHFEYVVIDSAPVFASDDATTLAPKMDGVLFVVRGSFTRASLARQALELLYQRQAKVLGLIFNRANPRAGSYSYYKYADYYHSAKRG
jgi:capsular exopolysaccharide synthesis family protein